MDIFLRRAVGLFFLVGALQYLPMTIYMVGVENPYGPSWGLVVVPLLQGGLMAAAGAWLYRTPARQDQGDVTLAWPSMESALQIVGVYFLVSGLVSMARPVSGVLLFSESVGMATGGEIAAAATSILVGGCLVQWSARLDAFLKRKAHAPGPDGEMT